MKDKIIAALLLATMSNATSAQSLDIGGVEVRIGQDINDALKSLSFYSVNFNGKGWFVTSNKNARGNFLGSIGATNNKIDYVAKSYEMNDDANFSKLYQSADKDLKRRGGVTCIIYEKEFAERSGVEYIRGFEKKCGAYKLVYFIPSKMADGQIINSSMSMFIGDARSQTQ